VPTLRIGWGYSLTFREEVFPETELPEMPILGNPHSPGPIGPTFSRGAYPLPIGPKALREALSGCAGAPDRFALLRVEVCSIVPVRSSLGMCVHDNFS
jgi:hypothetical protein